MLLKVDRSLFYPPALIVLGLLGGGVGLELHLKKAEVKLALTTLLLCALRRTACVCLLDF